jgi:hypothetical protein
VANEVNAAVQAMKTAACKSPLDLPRGHAGLGQLPPRHDPELPPRDGRGNPIRETRDGSNTHTVVNPANVGFAPSPASPGERD